MCSAEPLREFIRERLTAAAEEIFSEVHKTIVRYEEELRLMGIFWKPKIRLSRNGPDLQRESSDLKKSHVLAEASVIQQLCDQRRRSRQEQEEPEPQRREEEQWEPETEWIKVEEVEPESPWIKEDEAHVELHLIEEWKEPNPDLIKEEKDEPEYSLVKPEQQEPEYFPTRTHQNDIFSVQEEELKDQTRSAAFIQTCTLQECDLEEGELKTEQLFCHISDIVDSKGMDRSSSTESESLSETKKRFLTCDICGKFFKKKHNFDKHYQTHTGDLDQRRKHV